MNVLPCNNKNGEGGVTPIPPPRRDETLDINVSACIP